MPLAKLESEPRACCHQLDKNGNPVKTAKFDRRGTNDLQMPNLPYPAPENAVAATPPPLRNHLTDPVRSCLASQGPPRLSTCVATNPKSWRIL